MGIHYRDYMRDTDGAQWKMTPVVKTLIIAHAVVFFSYILLFYGIRPLAAHKDRILQIVGLVPENAINKLWVWQFLTYPFLHSAENLFHILFNLLCLYFFGRELELLYGRVKVLFLYFGGSFLAGVAYCVIHYIDAFNVPVIGASGAVMAVMVVYAVHFPYRKILFFFVLPLEIWVGVLILIGLDLTYALTSLDGSVAHVAHLGGALFGYLFYRFQGRVEDFLDGIEERARQKEAEEESRFEDTLNEILKKVHEEGIQSLSRKERDFLQRASERYQKKP